MKLVKLEQHRDEISPEEAIAELSAEALVCRDLMHAWMPYTAGPIRDGKRLTGYERVLRCRVCTTDRIEVLNTWGGIVSRHYNYPDNYLVKGVGRFSGDYKDRARLENVLQSMRALPEAVQG